MSRSVSADLRIGVIGTGMMGCEHIRNVQALAGAEVTAISDPNDAPLEWARRELGGRSVSEFRDHRELLDADVVDAVIVASPNHTHVDVLRDVLASDVPVLVEKPMCTTVDDCREIVERASRRDAITWVGLEYRYMAPIAALVDVVRSGRIGTTRMVAIREHRFPFLVKVGNWNRFNRNTGGTLVEKCCHFFDLMNLIVGARPVRVYASGAQDVNHLDEVYDGERSDILDNAFVIVDYDDGARALLDLCMFAEGSRWEQELVATGDAGKVEVHIPNFMELARGRTAELVVGGRGPDWPVSEGPVADDDGIGYVGHHHGASYLEHVDFAAAVRAGQSPAVTVDDGLLSVVMGAAAHRSIDEGRAVDLAELLG